MWPNQGVLLWGIIPFKMKYLGWFELAVWLLEFITGSMTTRVSLVLGLAGFLAFFGREVFDWCKDTISGYSAAGLEQPQQPLVMLRMLCNGPLPGTV